MSPTEQENHPEGKIPTLPTEEYFSLVRLSLEENGEAFVRVTGNSMRPLLRHLRDGVILVPPESIRVGDVVLFDRRNGRYALHRVLRLHGDTFTMLGDAQTRADRSLPREQIVGKVACIVRDGERMDTGSLFFRLHTLGALMTAPGRMLSAKLRSALRRLLSPGERVSLQDRR